MLNMNGAFEAVPYTSPDVRQALTVLLGRLAGCNWFHAVGGDTGPEVLRARSWEEAVSNLTEKPFNKEWSQMVLDAQNELSERAHVEDPRRFQEVWHPIAVAISPLVDAMLEATLLQRLKEAQLPTSIFKHYRGVIRLLFIAIAYFHELEIRTILRDIVSYMLIGHCPCGYVGQFPRGRLLVY